MLKEPKFCSDVRKEENMMNKSRRCKFKENCKSDPLSNGRIVKMKNIYISYDRIFNTMYIGVKEDQKSLHIKR